MSLKTLSQTIITFTVATLLTATAYAAPVSFSIDKISLVNSSDLSTDLLVIDDFSTTHAVDSFSSEDSYWSQVAAAEAVGGSRIIDLGQIGGGQVGGEQFLDVSSGSLNYTGVVAPDSSRGFSGRTVYQGQAFTEAGNVTGGLVDTDLTLGGAANGYLIDYTTAANTLLDLTILGIDNGGFLPNAASGEANGLNGSGSIFIAFGSTGFANGGPALDTNVLSLFFSVTETDVPVSVSEPLTSVLFLLGLAGLFMTRRRQA